MMERPSEVARSNERREAEGVRHVLSYILRHDYLTANSLLLAEPQPSAISHVGVQASLQMSDAICGEVVAADREIRPLLRPDPRAARLSAIPRIGPVTAAVVVSEI